MRNPEDFKIYIVEDDEWYRELLFYNLSLNPDFVVKTFSSGKELLQALHEQPEVITLDYRLPDMDGAEVLKQIKQLNPEIEVIMISQQEKIETAVELLKLGAYDYLVKDTEIKGRLLNTVNHIFKNRELKKTISTLETEVRKKYDFENLIIGNSPAIQKIFSLMDKAINNNLAVSISGETGTGKELVAKAIHYNSKRKDKPLVIVNMAAIPSELAESELLGHEKGSFTGANARRLGKFEEANGGTIFLDEIGEMDISLQAKLLRVLQERELNRVGGNEVVKIDVRLITATNKNLLEEVRNNAFREDLYYRIIGLNIQLPPLRERANDIIVLANYFITNFVKENNLEPKTFSVDAKKKLMAYPYPGNIRELKSIVELATVMTSGDEIEPGDIVLNPVDKMADFLTEELTLKEYNEKIIFYFLEKYDDNVKEVSKRLDIGKSTIYRLLQEKEKKESGN